MTDSDIQWFVMRDLTHYHSKSPAYKMLDGLKIENFTPKVQKLVVRGGKRERIEVPFIHDLLFVHDSRLTLDPIVEKVPTFQYRFLKGRIPMIVRDKEIEQFKKAVESSESPNSIVRKKSRLICASGKSALSVVRLTDMKVRWLR